MYEEAGSTGYEYGEIIVGQESSLCSDNLQRRQSMREDSTEIEKRRQQRVKVMKDMTKRIRSKGRVDAQNRWWVAELLAADCEKAWLHPEEEETIKNEIIGWKMEKEDDRRKMDELHQRRVNQMIKSPEGSAGLFAHNHEAPSMERRSTDPDARRRGCQVVGPL